MPENQQQAPPQQPQEQGPPPGIQGPPPGVQGVANPSYNYNAQGPPPGYAQPGQPGYGQQPPPGTYYGQQQGQPPPQGGPAQQGYPPPPPGYYPQPGMAMQSMPGQPMPGQPMPGQAMPGQPLPGQPAQIQWMQRPDVPGCPPGLEYLTQIDQILVHQQVELFEVFTNWETQNRYQIKNSLGQQIFFAHEESDTCHRQCCGPQRGFIMHITDNLNQEVMRIERQFKCCAGWNCCAGSQCCAMEVEIQAPVGQTVGFVRQKCSFLAPKYSILDAQQQEVLQIEGPTCICQGPCCTYDQEFKVFSADLAHEVGKISKQWSGFVKEYFTRADNFGVSFPMDLDVKVKAVMLGAVFLIDFMFFEQQQNNNNN